MAIEVLQSDTFEEWRIKTNQIATDSYTATQIGDMVTGTNVENGINVTFDSVNNTLDFDVDDFDLTLAGDLTGVATITNLANTSITASINTNYVASASTSGNGISGSASSIGGAFTVTSNATSSSAGNTIVFRDASGDFATNHITANNIIANGSLYVNWNDTSSDIYMGDSDNGYRRIHNDSDRLGFLKSDDAWGAWCDDNGNWLAAGDITAEGGDMYATTFHGNATTANYADLAENYRGDGEYEAGTVMAFGGDWEVTQSASEEDTKIIGVVSTAPAYLMNNALVGNNVVPIALTGRVPCKVTGTIERGDMLVSNGDGTARSESNPKMGSVLGKALEDSEGDNIIEVVVGKL